MSSTDAVVEMLLQLLHQAYHGNKEERTDATARLESIFTSAEAPQHLLALLLAGTTSTLAPAQSLSALLYAKNCFTHTTPDSILQSSPTIVLAMEETIFDGIFTVPATHRRVLIAISATLMSGFEWSYVDRLLPMMEASSQNIAQTPADYAIAALELLYVYAKRYKTVHLEPMEVKLEVCGELVAMLPRYLAYDDFRVSRMVLKLMECVSETALQQTSAKTIPGNALDAWTALWVAFPEQHHARAVAAGGATYSEYVRCVKRIASTTFSIMNDATRRKKPAPFAAHFRQTMAEPFMAVWRQWLSFCIQQEDRTMHKKSELFAIRFLKLCTLDERLFTTALRPHALAIIEGLFFPYLCHNAEDEEVFADADNLSDFVQYMMEEGVGNGELTQRQAASNAILSMLGGKKQFHDTAGLLQELLGVLTSGLSQPDTPENLPRLFGFLHLLSILRKYLRQVPDIWTTQMAQVLMRFVAPRLQPNVASIALRCKAIVVAQRYSKVPMPTEEDFASFMQMCCSLVGDADARVRLSAIDMMCSLLEMKHARPYLQPILVPLVQECMAFLNTVHTTYVPTVILHLATHFAPELTPVMGSLGSSLTQHFLATTFDLQQQEDGGDVEANMSAYERAAFSADALLDAIFTVVTSCGEAPEALAAMRPDVLRMVERVLREPDCFDFMDKSLGILLHVVTFTKPISADLWAMLPLVFGSVESGIGVDFFSTVEEVLDNFVSGATVEYLSNDEVMEATYAVCEKMLVGGVVCTTECQLAPAQLIEAMLHQSIKHPGIFDRHLPRFLHLLLRALVHPDIAVGDVRIRLWCLAAVMDAFFYDAATTMELIVQAGAYPNLFDAMFQFFGGCFTDFPEIAAVYATSSSAAPKSGKKKSAKTRNEAAEVVEQLSILTRKVIALGLSSLVRVMASVASGATTSSASMVGAAANFMAHHAAPSVALIQYCIFTNEELLQARNQLAVVNLDKIRRGEEEEVEDVDLNDDEVLGVDGGDDLNEVYDDVSEADLDDENVGLAMDEGDEYDSPIDDVNEVTPLLQWLREVGQQCAAIASCVRPAADFQRAEKTAADYRRLCVELEQAMAADFDQRRAAAS